MTCCRRVNRVACSCRAPEDCAARRSSVLQQAHSNFRVESIHIGRISPTNDSHQRAGADGSPCESDLIAGSVACDCSSRLRNTMRGGSDTYVRPSDASRFRMSASIRSRSLPNCAARSRRMLRISSEIESDTISGLHKFIRRANHRGCEPSILTYPFNGRASRRIHDVLEVPTHQVF